VVTHFSGERHVCREVVVFAVQAMNQRVLFARRKLSVLFAYIEAPAGVAVEGA
jgi:hypothetical protein